jgi:hypothetical protein
MILKMFVNAVLSLLLLTFGASAASANLDAVKDKLYDKYQLDLNGFVEARNGWRLDRDQDEKDASIAEVRGQLELNKDLAWASFNMKTDFNGDLVEEKLDTSLRELNISASPLDNMDIIAGRQILTWGTGDLLFINDLFAKDWKSFFIGRDDEYLKAPSDALKTSLFFADVNLDLVYIPLFNGSNFVDGDRLSYWHGLQGKIGDRSLTIQDENLNRFGRDSEFAARLSKNIGSLELALYAYNGFWQTPEGVNPANYNLIHPRLSVFGFSARQPLGGGIANIEAGYYDSEDHAGDDPFIRNSEVRLLTGFEHELGSDFTGAVQYYLEWKQDYDDYVRNLMPGSIKADEYRSLLTMRLTKLMMQQNLTLGVFVYYSPSDNDVYLRPKAKYKINDQWTAEVGGNIFAGANDYTFWGQFADNTNLYASLRWSF